MGHLHTPKAPARVVVGGDGGPTKSKEMSQDSGVRPETYQTPHHPSAGLDCSSGYNQVMTFKLWPCYAMSISVQKAWERGRSTPQFDMNLPPCHSWSDGLVIGVVREDTPGLVEAVQKLG